MDRELLPDGSSPTRAPPRPRAPFFPTPSALPPPPQSSVLPGRQGAMLFPDRDCSSSDHELHMSCFPCDKVKCSFSALEPIKIQYNNLLYGFAYGGPFGHFLHKLMDVIFKGKKDKKTVAKKVDAVVYLVDAFDKERFVESKKELDALLSDESLANVPFLILGNKIDIPYAASEEELHYYMGLSNFTTGKGNVNLTNSNARPLEVFMCSIVGKMGYGDGFKWLSQYIK